MGWLHCSLIFFIRINILYLRLSKMNFGGSLKISSFISCYQTSSLFNIKIYSNMFIRNTLQWEICIQKNTYFETKKKTHFLYSYSKNRKKSVIKQIMVEENDDWIQWERFEGKTFSVFISCFIKINLDW